MRAASKFRPRTKPPAERRDEIMNAARRLFLKQGAGPTTIEQITSGANVAKGTFYLYFSSKEDVLAALGERFAQELLATIKAAIAEKANEDWKGKLGVWAQAGVHGYLDSMRLHDIIFYGSRPRTREGRVDNIIIDHLCGLLQGGVDAGAWSVDDARFTAVFLFSGLHGVVDAAHLKGKCVERSRLAERLERICFRAVGLSRR
ncbi:MAG TPA: TetR/AcrR family transcriptional regulator [Candidatus Acidoferrales bacterium]